MTEKLNMFKARSTWVVIFTIVANMLLLVRPDIVGDDPNAWINASTEVVMGVIGSVGAAWVYIERTIGSKANNLTIRG